MPDPVEVSIKVTGLALCFLKGPAPGREKVWNVAFLCDQYHPLDFKHNGVSIPDWRTKGQDIFLCVERTDADNTLSTHGSGKLLNLSDPTYAHGVNLSTRLSHLTIQRRKSRTDLVWLQIPHSTMEVTDPHAVSIMQTDPGETKPVDVQDCGKTATFKFRVAADFNLTSREYTTTANPSPGGTPFPVPGGVIGTPRLIRIADAISGKINFGFDNDCVQHGCRFNDTRDLYEFVVHREGLEEVRFSTWSAERAAEGLNTFRNELYPDREIDLRHLLYHVRASPYGNCDPTESNPPPGP